MPPPRVSPPSSTPWNVSIGTAEGLVSPCESSLPLPQSKLTIVMFDVLLADPDGETVTLSWYKPNRRSAPMTTLGPPARHGFCSTAGAAYGAASGGAA